MALLPLPWPSKGSRGHHPNHTQAGLSQLTCKQTCSKALPEMCVCVCVCVLLRRLYIPLSRPGTFSSPTKQVQPGPDSGSPYFSWLKTKYLDK